MTMCHSAISRIPTVGALGAALVTSFACGPSGGIDQQSSQASLTRLGDRNIEVDSGARVDLDVRYENASGNPLQGVVEFEIRGEAQGARLLSPAGTTDSSGRAGVTLDTFSSGQTSFEVEASAFDAEPVTWSIDIGEPEAPLDPSGVYDIDSRFDVLSGLQDGGLDDALSALLDLTREPGNALLLSAAEADWISEDEALEAGPELSAFLEETEPDRFERLEALGRHVVDISRGVGVQSTLAIEGGRSDGEADHRLSGLVIPIGEERRTLSLEDLGVEEAEARRVALSPGEGENELFFAEHTLPLPYESMLAIALDEILTSLLDRDSGELGSFFEDQFPCVPIAEWLTGRFDMDPIVADLACQDAVEGAVARVLDRIALLDEEEFQIVISGEARAVDSDADETPDRLRDGTWQGVMEHGGEPAAMLLEDLSEFEGERTTSGASR